MRNFPLLPLLRFLLTGLILLIPNAHAAKAADRPTILVFGDSLSAGFGISPDAAWPSLLAKRLQEKGFDYSLANASISGETTSGGRARLAAVLSKYSPKIVLIALGSNDGLRGLPIATIRDNLRALVEMAQQKNVQVILIGQRLPPNYGPYAEEFRALFAEVAQEKKTPLIAFLLAAIAQRPEFFQADNLHPTAAAQPLLLDTVWPGVLPYLILAKKK